MDDTDEVYVLTYLGNVIDAYETEAEAKVGRGLVLDSIFSGHNDYWDADDFEDRDDARRQFLIEPRTV